MPREPPHVWRNDLSYRLFDPQEHPHVRAWLDADDNGRQARSITEVLKHGRVNATLPKGMDPADVTLEQAVTLLAARKPGRGKPAPGKPGRGKAGAKSGDLAKTRKAAPRRATRARRAPTPAESTD